MPLEVVGKDIPHIRPGHLEDCEFVIGASGHVGRALLVPRRGYDPAIVNVIEDDPRYDTAPEIWQVSGLTYEFYFITEEEARTFLEDMIARQYSTSLITPTLTRCPRRSRPS